MEMTKTQALDLLGGSVASVAAELGVTRQAVEKWPDVLPARVADRVRGAWARKTVPHLLGSPVIGTKVAGVEGDVQQPHGAQAAQQGVV